MNLTYGIIVVVGLLVAAILGMIVMDPGYLSEAPPMPTGEKPTVCTMEWLPQCGVDGKTYGNLCTLHFANVELSHPGECPDSEVEPEATGAVTEPIPEATGAVTEPIPEATPEPTPEPTPEVPTMGMPVAPQTHIVSLAEGSGVPGCEDTLECYLPYSLEIQVRDTISWDNVDSAAHTVTAGSSADGPTGVFDSSLFMAGTTFEFTFDEAGTYPYFCMVHPWMTGEIIVNEVEEMIVIPEEPTIEPTPEEPISEDPIVEEIASGPAEVTMAQGSGAPGCEETLECYLPYQVEISSGETVIWTNTDSAVHTVTSGLPASPNGVFDSGMVMVNQTYEFTFTDAGEYDYYCMLHPWMTGKVMVS